MGARCRRRSLADRLSSLAADDAFAASRAQHALPAQCLACCLDAVAAANGQPRRSSHPSSLHGWSSRRSRLRSRRSTWQHDAHGQSCRRRWCWRLPSALLPSPDGTSPPPHVAAAAAPRRYRNDEPARSISAAEAHVICAPKGAEQGTCFLLLYSFFFHTLVFLPFK